MLKHILFSASLILGLPTALLAEVFSQTITPDWVSARDVPAADHLSERFMHNGRETLLEDHQILIRDSGHSIFRRDVFQISTRAGLDDAGLVSLFRAREDALSLNWVRIHRGDAVLDVTEQLDFTVMQREPGLFDGIVTGDETLSAPISQLQVGDILDIAWTKDVVPPIFEHEFQHGLTELPFAPVRARYHSYTISEGRPLYVTRSPAIPLTVTHKNGFVTKELALFDAEPPEFDLYQPIWRHPFGEVLVTTFSDWEQISSGLAEAYAPDGNLGPLAQRQVQEIIATSETETDRVTAALRYVQSTIRYHGDQIGAGGYIPREPYLVEERGWGDCKDKALLLISMLDVMGIRADVALVNTFRGKSLDTVLPGPWLFDHAIVRVHGTEGIYFLDPTEDFQGGRGPDIAHGDFGFALPLIQGGSTLVALPDPTSVQPLEEVFDTYDFVNTTDVAAELYVDHIYRGALADQERRKLNVQPLTARGKDFLETLKYRFEDIEEIGPLKVTDDLDLNEIRYTVKYAIPQSTFEENDQWTKFWLSPSTTKYELPDPDDLSDKDAELPGSVFSAHRVRLMNAPYAINQPEEFTEDNEFFAFTRQGNRGENWIEAAYTLNVKKDVIPGAEIKNYSESFEKYYANSDHWYNLHYKGQEPELTETVVFGNVKLGQLLNFVFLSLFAVVCIVAVRNSYRTALEQEAT